ncbi:HIG1 domain-containing protein [Croceibacterium aestuarii]|uniref:HIG1 domain-containing protein n=1 Tax=Croceibacterium aestuarii TaxID=3064139 RepID=UPI00272EDBC9|nr:HIG1 domain-containing protein [Croceibacterium sp. D39]
MQTFLIIVLVLLMLGVIVSLVRGIIAFLQANKADIEAGGGRQKELQLKQNRMMMNRIMYQAGAILIVFLLLSLTR